MHSPANDGRPGNFAGHEPLGIVGGAPETSSRRDLQNCIISRIGENGVDHRLIGYRSTSRTVADRLIEPAGHSTIIDLVSKRRVDKALPPFRQRPLP
jgi:hypothetical protein